MSLPLHGRARSYRLGRCWHDRQKRQDRRSSLNPIAGLYLDGGIAIEQNIHPRAKLDESHPFAAGHLISHFEIKNDAPRDQSGDLLEDYGAACRLPR